MSAEKKHVTNAELMVGYGNTNATCNFYNTTFDQIYGGKKIKLLFLLYIFIIYFN